MGFLFDNCTFSILNEETIHECPDFSCGHSDLDDFFLNESVDYNKQLLGKSYCFRLNDGNRDIVCAFTVSNSSINTEHLPNSRKKKVRIKIPNVKHSKNYPAVLIGRLGVNKDFKRRGIGVELMNFIKAWFIQPNNKTGCRYIVVDAYNEDEPKNYYQSNSFDFIFSTEEQELQYSSLNKKSLLHPKTRLMYFDLISLTY